MLKSRKQALSEPWKPHNYQKRAVKFLLEQQCAGLLLDPGLGKTSITLAAFALCKEHGTARGMLVFSPLRVAHLVWPAEVQKWADFNSLKMVVLHGDNMEKKLQEDADIYVINYEGIEWLFGTLPPAKPVLKNVMAHEREAVLEKYEERKAAWLVENKKAKARTKRIMEKCDILTVDELSKFKHTNTNRFQIIKPHLDKFPRRWGLTGSPAANGLLDLFGQCYILDMGNALGPFITHYRANYFDSVGYGGYTYVPKPGAEKRIYERLKPLMLRMDAKDYLDLPEKFDDIIKVELDPKARAVYDMMENENVAQLDLSVVTAASNGVASMKCRQIASGAVYLDPVDPETGMPRSGKREFEVIHDVKIKALCELIEELQGQPLLVGYEFQHDIERIKKKLGKNIPVIGSGTSTKQAKEIERAWNNNELQYLFGHPASMGHGLNLQDGQCIHVCWFTTTWDYELYDQFVRRVLRQGNKTKRVFVHHIVIRDSVDELVMNTIRRKKRTQGDLLDALNKYRGKRKLAA